MKHIERIVEWNKQRLLDKQEFSLKTECVNIIEELIEANYRSLKSEKARQFANQIYGFIESNEKVSKEHIADAFADIIVYSVGAILKLGYDPNIVMDEVLKEIESRTGSIIDGKFVKDKNAQTYTADFSKALINS